MSRMSTGSTAAWGDCGRGGTNRPSSTARAMCSPAIATSNPTRSALIWSPGQKTIAGRSTGTTPWGPKTPLLREHATYTALAATVAARRAAYRDLFGPGLTVEQVETIRDATQRGWVPGNDRFRQQVERALGRRVDPPRRGRPPKAPAYEKLAGRAE